MSAAQEALERVRFDVDELTFEEFEVIEEETGENWSAFVSRWIEVKQAKGAQQVAAKDLRLATWLMLRRRNPDITMNDVKAMAFTEVWS